MQKARQVGSLARRYPLPVVAFAGLLSGSAATWILTSPDQGSQIWFATLVAAGLPVVYKTLRGMLRGRFAADVVAMLAIVFAVIFRESFAGVIIVLMQTGGESLEDFGFGRASAALDGLVARAPRTAVRVEHDSLRTVKVEEVAPGDLLLVRTGDLVPVDGEVTSEGAEIDESAITGEPLPRRRGPGDRLLSGSVNAGGVFRMTATAASGQSQYARIIEMVRKAEEEKPAIVRMADRYAVWFTPLTIAVGILGVAITGSPATFLAVLVVATPCPLILATPIAVISGINRAASKGVIVKGGAALEQAAMTEVVVFDKTGTLTFGAPTVDQVVGVGSFPPDDLLRLASAVEQLSSHPVAQALVRRGSERFAELPTPEGFRETPGAGVEGVVEGRRVAVGSRHFCESRTSEKFPAEFEAVESESRSQGKLVSSVTVDGHPAGIVVFHDEMRPGVPEMLVKLRDLGVKRVAMLTGDGEQNAEVVARRAGIQTVRANLLPQDKAAEVRRLREVEGVTIMVGDGINDAPALATATVGIAMGAHGTGISAEAADMVLLVDDVTAVADAVETGKRMSQIAKEGIALGLGSSLVFMAAAALGYIPPASGAILQEVIDVSVILNALRVR
jgi:heavy metal translocating P-type ATPase